MRLLTHQTELLPAAQRTARPQVHGPRIAARRPSGLSSVTVGPVRGLPYLPALDGLRAIAVLAVIAYHADEGWLPGGYLGVEVFFTISGYLITALLVTEYERTGTLDMRRFWVRRARRLLPALVVLLVGVTLLSLITARDALGSLAGQATAALAYVMNWSLIATEQSYFESFGRPPLLQHLWSLAIEEQFYLVFPVLFLLGRRLLGRRVSLVLVVLGIVASTALMWSLFDPADDPSRLYYGTDTRAAGIFVGVALAMIWRPWAGAGSQSLRGAALPDLLGLVGLGVLMTQFVVLGAYEPRLYEGGFLLVALATAAVIGAIVTPGSLLAMPLAWRGLRWIGTRSYSLYLWHWPLFMVLRPGVDTVVGDPWLTLVRLGATVMLAEISFTYVEQPIREGRFTAQLQSLRHAAPEHDSMRRGAIVTALAVAAMVAIGNAQLPVDEGVPDVEVVLAGPPAGEVIRIQPARVDPYTAERAAAPIPLEDLSGAAPSTSLLPRVAGALAGIAPPAPGGSAPGTAPTATGAARYGRVLVHGDSVVVGAAEALHALGPHVEVDADIGRQWHQVVGGGARPGSGDAVVVHLGSNGATNTQTIDAVLGQFADADRVVLVTVRVPRPWERTVNTSLRRAVERWPNARLADWHAASDGTPAWFGRDGVHVNARGAVALADLVDAALGAD